MWSAFLATKIGRFVAAAGFALAALGVVYLKARGDGAASERLRATLDARKATLEAECIRRRVEDTPADEARARLKARWTRR